MPTPIKYIGHRPFYREGAYGTKVEFAQGQTLMFADEIAAKLLKHPDVYVLGDGASPPAAPAVVPEPEDRTGEKDIDQQDAIDSLRNMNKRSLSNFAKTHFRVDLPDAAIDEMRAKVRGMVEQYGLN